MQHRRNTQKKSVDVQYTREKCDKRNFQPKKQKKKERQIHKKKRSKARRESVF